MGSGGPCICGCGQRGVHRHHCIYQQEIRRVSRAGKKLDRAGRDRLARAIADPRNLVWMNFDCHAAHHGRSKPLHLYLLPDSVYEFAVELLGAGPAFNYLRRMYRGGDVRLDALLSEQTA